MYPEEVFFNLNTSGSKTRFWNKVFIIPMLKPAGLAVEKYELICLIRQNVLILWVLRWPLSK